MPFESLIKKELARLLPQRYAVTSGYLSDREGNTAGHCDLIAFNSVWFSPVKSAEEKGQEYLPVEGVYAVGEVKQTKMMIVGELQDGLVFDSAYQKVTGTALTHHIIPMFAGQRRHRLIFLTKSTQVQHALELPPTPQVVFSWSVNAEDVGTKWEHGTPLPSQRFSAAEKMKRAGWPIRFRLDAMSLPARSKRRNR